MQEHATSFAPIAGKRIHTLILGTMPGQASLAEQQYYAHPRNALWPILNAIINGTDVSYSSVRDIDYESRCELLTDHGYALWDVLANCSRPGSLDSNIKRSSEVPNDIASIVRRHPELTQIICNGGTAETLFKRHISASLPRPFVFALPSTKIPNDTIRVQRLPSTSPAMASLTLNEKYQLWAEGLLG